MSTTQRPSSPPDGPIDGIYEIVGWVPPQPLEHGASESARPTAIAVGSRGDAIRFRSQPGTDPGEARVRGGAAGAQRMERSMSFSGGECRRVVPYLSEASGKTAMHHETIPFVDVSLWAMSRSDWTASLGDMLDPEGVPKSDHRGSAKVMRDQRTWTFRAPSPHDERPISLMCLAINPYNSYVRVDPVEPPDDVPR